MIKINRAAYLSAVILAISACTGPKGPAIESINVRNSDSGQEYMIQIYQPSDISAKGEYPVMYVADMELFESDGLVHKLDSLNRYGWIRPVILAFTDFCDTNGAAFFADNIITAVERRYPCGKDSGQRIFCGTAAGADFGIHLGMTNPGICGEYWCFEPTMSDAGAYGMLGQKIRFHFSWNLKNNTEAAYYQYPVLINSIRKRGGEVTESSYNDLENIAARQEEFLRLLTLRFQP